MHFIRGQGCLLWLCSLVSAALFCFCPLRELGVHTYPRKGAHYRRANYSMSQDTSVAGPAARESRGKSGPRQHVEEASDTSSLKGQ